MQDVTFAEIQIRKRFSYKGTTFRKLVFCMAEAETQGWRFFSEVTPVERFNDAKAAGILGPAT
jgi:hypothetical protein